MTSTKNAIYTTSHSDSSDSKRTVPNDSPTAYHNLAVVKRICKGKFSLYLTSSKITSKNYVMKVFNYDGKQPHSYYKNEIRFAPIRHTNIIDFIQYEENKDTLQRGQLKKVSYILMEYAPYGDFLKFINNNTNKIDEKLARTYFRQLIGGLEHLHKHGVAHLDLKPENLLIGANYSLKITDFDLSHMHGDEKILSRGTRCCRGPELFQSDSSSSSGVIELEDPFAADIYSTGVLLFILKSGVYPHSENGFLNGVCLAELLYEDNKLFWKKHCEIEGKERSFYDDDFIELFNNMVKANPKERWSIEKIKESKWYNGTVYSQPELEDQMKKLVV